MVQFTKKEKRGVKMRRAQREQLLEMIETSIDMLMTKNDAKAEQLLHQAYTQLRKLNGGMKNE